jgi:hypothetical protein
MKSKSEFKNFTALVDKVLSVPHSEIKAKLDAEKRVKKRKKSKRNTKAQ